MYNAEVLQEISVCSNNMNFELRNVAYISEFSGNFKTQKLPVFLTVIIHFNCVKDDIYFP